MWISRSRKEAVEGWGEDGGKRGEDNGAIRGDPPIGRYFGVAVPDVGRKRGDDGKDRTPEPLPLRLFSKADKKVLVLEELCRECRTGDRLLDGGFSRKMVLSCQLLNQKVQTFGYSVLALPPLFYF
jgi:hypothetical protein